MSVKQTKDGKWSAEIDRQGIPRKRQKGFESKADAEQFERDYLARFTRQRIATGDDRSLSELIDLWDMYHGVNLADGVRRKRCLLAMSKALRNPKASALTAEMFVELRYKRMKTGISAKTLNNHQAYLSSMFERLIKLDVIAYPNPLERVDFVKIQERQLSYLSRGQIDVLLATIKEHCKNNSTWFVAHLCLRTGARWGEAEQLRVKQLRDGRVTYEFTKSKKTRTVPIDRYFYAALLEYIGKKGPNDRVFSNCIGSFRRAVSRSGIELPRGQMTHILRHTFASHFVMNGGHILTLQKILGHSDIKMTMRYAHLSPDFLADALKFNPVA